jgi:hypothetical protein
MSVRTKFHGTGTYLRTYQISRYKYLPSVRTKFHGTRTYRPYVPNFAVQVLTVRTYQISRYKYLPSVYTTFHCTWIYRPYVPDFMNTSLDSDVNESINIKTTQDNPNTVGLPFKRTERNVPNTRNFTNTTQTASI